MLQSIIFILTICGPSLLIFLLTLPVFRQALLNFDIPCFI
jgi:hypothetical protein